LEHPEHVGKTPENVCEHPGNVWIILEIFGRILKMFEKS